MSIIPLDVQRRCERRWAARFMRPVAPATPKNIIVFKDAINSLAREATRCRANEAIFRSDKAVVKQRPTSRRLVADNESRLSK
jgi:hypothetical protein